jgi:Domain of unknown function (DUF4203)
MNEYAWAGQITAPLAVAIGVLACFGGYRLLKLLLGIVGFAAGAAGGWAAGSYLAPGHTGIALACAVAGGIFCAVLCIWLFLVGIFVLGASAGVVAAAALCGGTGQPAQPLLLLIVALVFGVLALLLQKLMIIVSTAFCGSYLVTAGLWHFVTAGQSPVPLWFNHLKPGSAGLLGWAALVFWLLLALIGARFQYRGRRKRETHRQDVQRA